MEAFWKRQKAADGRQTLEFRSHSRLRAAEGSRLATNGSTCAFLTSRRLRVRATHRPSRLPRSTSSAAGEAAPSAREPTSAATRLWRDLRREARAEAAAVEGGVDVRAAEPVSGPGPLGAGGDGFGDAS